MPRQFAYFSGKASWVRNVTPDPKYNRFTMVLHPIPDDMAKIWELKKGADGIKNTIGKDDDGEFIRISRPASKLIRGKIVTFAPPVMVDRDNRPIHPDTLIGNGSDVTVKVEIYTYPVPGSSSLRGKALRWEGMRVDNLIPYTQDSYDDQQKSQVRGLDEQPSQPEF